MASSLAHPMPTRRAEILSAMLVAVSDPRTTLASARYPETVLYHAKHEKRRSKPARSNKTLWKFFYGLFYT